MSDFLNYGDLENKIVDWFGQPTLDIVKERAKGNIDFLNRLPEEAKIAILTRLPLEELPKMGLLNKEFAELCKSNELWEKMCEQNGITIDENVRSLGLQIGFKKIFFSNKGMLRSSMFNLFNTVEIQRHIRKMKKQSTFITAWFSYSWFFYRAEFYFYNSQTFIFHKNSFITVFRFRTRWIVMEMAILCGWISTRMDRAYQLVLKLDFIYMDFQMELKNLM